MHPLLSLSENVRIALVGISALSIVGLVELHPWGTPHDESGWQTILETASTPDRLILPAMEAHLRGNTSASIREINPELETLLAEGEYGTLNDRLLNLAASAVADSDDRHLLEILSLLGQVAIEQGQLDSAEVYLFEALDLIGDRVNGPEGAEVYMQLGRTFLRSREIARGAGYAYDALQIGRNQLHLGRFNLAEQNIRLAIDHSLSIARFNTAASGYLSLGDLYIKLGDRYQAEEAGLEAARLFSASGQEGAASDTLEKLRAAGMEIWRIEAVEREIGENLQSYEREMTQIGAARDYRRLYHYYLAEDNLPRAWHFRLLASASLKNVSKRTLFHRQQGVLALLYNSNAAMKNAKHFFDEASERFTQNGMVEKRDQTESMQRDIY